MGEGEIQAQGEKKAALVALRKVRKRDVKKMLAEREGEKGKRKIRRWAKGKS